MKISRIFALIVVEILTMTITASAKFTARLDWQDNSNNEDFFVVQRGLNGAAFVDLASSFLPFYDDTTSVSGPVNNVYVYRVAAENAAGRSAYTNEAFKTILAQATPPPPPATLWTFCANENNQCNFTGTKEVRYGANGVYFSRILSNGVLCANSVFGDPLFGTAKTCERQSLIRRSLD